MTNGAQSTHTHSVLRTSAEAERSAIPGRCVRRTVPATMDVQRGAATLDQVQATQHVRQCGAQAYDLVLLGEHAPFQVMDASGQAGLLRFEHLV